MIRRARVLAVYPNKQSCDLCFLDDGWTVSNATIAAGLSSDGCDWGVPSVPKPSSQATAPGIETNKRMLVALCIVDYSGMPTVIGFTQAYGAALAVAQDDRKLYVHPSTGAYYTFAPDGSFEAYTAGAYFRLGSGPAHAPLGNAISGSLPAPPAGASMSATLGTPNGSITVDPAGVITAKNAKGTITMDASGNVTMNLSGTLTATYTSATLNGPVTINGTLKVTEDATIGGKSFLGHEHGNGNDGDNTTPPI
jgi:predicted RecA/RadA family phage recombinase